VTVREICKASNANVAAVNYHFGDKAGLYRAVVTYAIEVMRETNELSQRAGDGLSPEEQIRGFVRVFVGRLTSDGPNAWIHRLMAREMEHPTDALDQVMTQVVKPRLEYLSGVAGQVMGLPPSDPRVKRCIASLQMQCLMGARRIPAALEKTFGPAMRDVESAVDHIAEFSLGGMRAIASGK
jgi:AcrR family transcriptional regulator